MQRTSPPEKFLEDFKRLPFYEKRREIIALGQEASEDGIRILVSILQGDSWYFRDRAVEALADAGERAAPPLKTLLYGGLWYTRASAARTLGLLRHHESLPELVHLLFDSNQTVQAACLESIADLVRDGAARDTARLFWNQGARRAEDLKRLLQAVHPDAGNQVADLMADPDSLLREDTGSAETETETEDEIAPSVERRNA
jgi:HEAT repeat protein